MDGLSKPMSKLGQLMMLRAIGVAIVLEGTMLPTMELLLRHAIQYFNLKGSALLRDPDSKLDDLEQFLADLPNLDKEEQVTTQAITPQLNSRDVSDRLFVIAASHRRVRCVNRCISALTSVWPAS